MLSSHASQYVTHDNSYDNDDAAPSKDQIPTQAAAPEPTQSNEDPGYGEEPDTVHDLTSFENDTAMQEQSTNGAGMESGAEAHEYSKEDEPGIRMKEDG